MPYILNPNGSSSYGSLGSVHYSYKYPLSMKLQPGSEQHGKILSFVMDCAQKSRDAMSNRFETWNTIDKTLTAYIPLDEKEETLRDVDSRKPVSTVVPVTYAVMDTILTYLIGTFMQTPIFRYEGRGPEDTVGAMLMEAVIDAQADRFKAGLALHTMFRDMLAYGFGAVTPVWTKKMGYKRVAQPEGLISSFGRMFQTGFKKQREEVTLFEGNRLYNIDPYKTFLDPQCSVSDIQDARYVGWLRRESMFDLLNQEEWDTTLFNCKYLKHIDGRSVLGEDSSERDKDLVRQDFTLDDSYRYNSDVIYLYVTLIPASMGLGNNDSPEKWLFAVAGDSVVIKAGPCELDHNMYPVGFAAAEYDGYSVSPLARLEITSGLQTFIDFLYNCYDDQTEVLTSSGWVGLPNLTEQHEVSTVDPITLSLTFEKPKQLFQYDYNGYMMQFKSSRMDICVTPNHNMLVKKRYNGQWEFMPAAVVAATSSNEYKTLGNLNWGGEAFPVDVKVPKLVKGKINGTTNIPSYLMLMFLGWFISEGSITRRLKGGYAVSIKQSKSENFEDIDSIMSAMPYNVTKYYDESKEAYSWTITDRGLYEWLLKECYEGGTHGEHKKLPAFLKGCDTFYLDLFFSRAMRGDGHWIEGHDNLGTYSTTSQRLSDDIQEVAIKLGYFSHVHANQDLLPSGKRAYCVRLSTNWTTPTISPRNCFRVHYVGKVYCFENSTHLTVTRRNGKVAVQGQSHMTNVRKAINDMFVVDPALININDLRNPSAGRLIRMRKKAWGRGVKDAVEQLQVYDITKQHLADVSFVSDLVDKVVGAPDALQGIMRQSSERRSATEFRETKGSALSRLERIAWVASLQAMSDLAYIYASQTQQFMSVDQYVKIVGRYEQDLRAVFGDASHALVDPLSILIDYDVKTGSAMLPSSGDPNQWAAMFQIIAANPQLAMQFDTMKIFQYWAKLTGAKNLEDFVLRGPAVQTQVLPDEEVAKQAQAGNIVPINEAMPA